MNIRNFVRLSENLKKHQNSERTSEILKERQNEKWNGKGQIRYEKMQNRSACRTGGVYRA